MKSQVEVEFLSSIEKRYGLRSDPEPVETYPIKNFFFFFSAIRIHIRVEFFDYFLVGSLGEQRNHDDGNETQNEGGKQFVNAENATKGFDEAVPYQNSGRARNHARQSAGEIRATPIKTHEHKRTEGGTEAGPSIGDDLKDGGILVKSDNDTEQEHCNERKAGNDHNLCIGGILLYKTTKDVLGDRGAGNEQI